MSSSAWHHGPLHLLLERGVYMVTAGTYQKHHHFSSQPRLKMLNDLLLEVACDYGWELRAWAVMSNHYHFVGSSPENPSSLKPMLSKLHTLSARVINSDEGLPGSKVWHQYWETRLTFDRSYLARLNYVHHNPVHHRVASSSVNYPWCSAAKFEAEAEPGFRRTVAAMPIDRLNVIDDF